MGSTSITPGAIYLSAFHRPPTLADILGIGPPGLPSPKGLPPSSGHFVPPPIFGPLTSPIPGLLAHHEVPLDLSSKLVLSDSPIRQASVIQHTKTVASLPEILPTCYQPKVDLERLQRLTSGQSSILEDGIQKHSDENSSNQSATNRMSYPREFKLMVIDYFYANGQNKYRTCKEFQITKSMLNGWIQKADKIRLSRPGSLKSGRSGRRPQFPDVERRLYELFEQESEKGNRVGNRWIRDTARLLAKEQCSRQELDGMCQFSERWLSNFKKRYKINLSKEMDAVGDGNSCSASSHYESEDLSPEKFNENDEISIVNEETDELESEHENDLDPCAENTKADTPNSENLVHEILNQPGELPIQAFYKKFPWLCKRSNPPREKGAEPNRRGRKVQFPEVERLLHERVVEKVAQNGRVSNKWLQESAKEIAKNLDPTFKTSSRFQFSDHWLHNFKKRYGLTLKPTKTDKKTHDSEADGSKMEGTKDQQQILNWYEQACKLQTFNVQFPLSREIKGPVHPVFLS